MRDEALADRLALAQGAYYVASGALPLVSMHLFEAITGPKADRWLVKTVGFLVAVLGSALTRVNARPRRFRRNVGGLTLLRARRKGRVTDDLAFAAFWSAVALAFVDVWYSLRGRISKVHLADAVAEAALALVGTVAGMTFTEGGFGAAVTRYYAVSASNDAGEGTTSAAASGTTFDVPGVPLDLSASYDPYLEEVTLTWAPPADDGGLPVTEYRVYAGDPGVGLALVATISGASFTEAVPAGDEARSYRVSAVNEAGEGAASDALEVVFVIPVAIDVSPIGGNTRINSRSNGNVLVAIFSTPELDAVSNVDTTSLTFGATGEDASLVRCNSQGRDLDGDGLPDLLCHFSIRASGLGPEHTEAVLKGRLVGRVRIEGTDAVEVR